MSNERDERIIFMAGETEGVQQGPERQERQNAGGGREKNVRPHGGGQPPERATPPAPPSREQASSGSEEVAHFPTAPDRQETPEEQAARERDEKIGGYLKEGKTKEALGMLFEDWGVDSKEVERPEVQKALGDLDAFLEERRKPEGERDAGKLEAASQALKGYPDYVQQSARALLRADGMDEEEVRRLLPEVPVAPTEEEGEEHGITGPTEDDQRTEQEREVEAKVSPFVQKMEQHIEEGDWKAADDERRKLLKMLKDAPWMKIAGRSLQFGVLYPAVAALLIYVALMAKTSGFGGKR